MLLISELQGKDMRRLSTKNYDRNRQIPLPEGLLNGQALGAVSGMKYGRSTVSYSGCECIAVYNALLMNGTPFPFPEIARYMERFRVLFGFWGTNFLALGHCLKYFGLHVRRFRSRRKIAAALEPDRPALLVYWTKRRFASSVHTVCIRLCDPDTVEILNAYNTCSHPVREKLPDVLKKKLIFAYIPEKVLSES